MRKNKGNDYDVNNSMEKQDKKEKKSKKTKKQKSNYDNILDEIKKEEESNYKQKILEEVNNSMHVGNKKTKNKKGKEVNKEHKKENNESIEKEEDFRENNKEKQEKEKENQKEKAKKQKKNNVLSDTFSDIANELNEQLSLEIENIFEINKKFNYPKTSPVFYIREDNSNNDLYQSPLSTNKIKELLNQKKIRPFLLKVKLIDIFTMKNYEPFSYFDFNDILAKNWSKNLEYSPIFLNEYNNMYEKNKSNIFNEKNEVKNKVINFTLESNKPKQLIFNNDKKSEKNKEKESDAKNNDITLSLNFTTIEKKGFNDLSLSVIKQLEGINLTKKQLDKITSIIEEVEEDEWTEIKSKKKEIEQKPFVGIVGLNESKQVIPEEYLPKKNKKKTKGKNKKKQSVNFENKFAAFKIAHDSDEEEDEK